ncbi:hypothetical protein [Streptomyces sp. NPDC001594]
MNRFVNLVEQSLLRSPALSRHRWLTEAGLRAFRFFSRGRR